MLYRKAINWPLGDDDDPHAIAVSFVFESAHGQAFAGHDRDGEIVEVCMSDAALNERLEHLAAQRMAGAPSPLSYPSPTRDALFADIFAAAERIVRSKEPVAGTELPAFEARANLWTIAEEELAGAVDRGEATLDERTADEPNSDPETDQETDQGLGGE
jgi:hypothetical protein